MLTVKLHDAQREPIGTAEIPDARAYPGLVILDGADGRRYFLRRGKNVGKDSDAFDEITGVVGESEQI